jgi:hypothetical protein
MFFERALEAGLRKKTLHQIANRPVFERFRAWNEGKAQAYRRKVCLPFPYLQLAVAMVNW